jgi:hypothetical protein
LFLRYCINCLKYSMKPSKLSFDFQTPLAVKYKNYS